MFSYKIEKLSIVTTNHYLLTFYQKPRVLNPRNIITYVQGYGVVGEPALLSIKKELDVRQTFSMNLMTLCDFYFVFAFFAAREMGIPQWKVVKNRATGLTGNIGGAVNTEAGARVIARHLVRSWK